MTYLVFGQYGPGPQMVVVAVEPDVDAVDGRDGGGGLVLAHVG